MDSPEKKLTRRSFLKGTAAVTAAAMTMPAFSKIAAADTLKTSAEIEADIKELSRKLGEATSGLKNLKAKIDEGIKTFSDKATAISARKGIEELRGYTTQASAIFADNAEISRFGDTVLKNVRDRQKMLREDKRFGPEDQKKLGSAWEDRVKKVTEATKWIEESRMKLLNLTYVLQNSENLIDKYMEVDRHAGFPTVEVKQEVTNTISQLAKDLKVASDDLDALVKGS